MDDDDLDTSEYYRDAQSFRALRKAKIENRFNCWLRISCSKQNKTVELLPVVLESKAGMELKAHSTVYS